MPQNPKVTNDASDDPFGADALIAQARALIVAPPTLPAAAPQMQLGLPSTYYQTTDTRADGAPPSDDRSGLPLTYGQDGAPVGGEVRLAENTPGPWDHVLGQPSLALTDGASLTFGQANDITSQLDTRLNQGLKPDPVLSPGAQATDYLRDTGFFNTSPGVQTRIDPIPGYAQTGPFAWRASNDQAFLDAVNQFNAKHDYAPGDPGYRLADMLKAQAMVEAGGSQKDFLSDPLQVNTGNWSDDKLKFTPLTGADEPMTPALSATAGLEWLDHKGWKSDGKTKSYQGDWRALRDYNGNQRLEPGSNGLPNREWYAKRVIDLSNAASARQK